MILVHFLKNVLVIGVVVAAILGSLFAISYAAAQLSIVGFIGVVGIIITLVVAVFKTLDES